MAKKVKKLAIENIEGSSENISTGSLELYTDGFFIIAKYALGAALIL